MATTEQFRTYVCSVDFFDGWKTRRYIEHVRETSPERAASASEWQSAATHANTHNIHKYFTRRVEEMAEA